MDDQTLILIGAFGGAAVGVLGGVVGTYYTIRNTNGPRERAFTIWGSLICWLVIAAFLAVMLVTPMPYGALLWLPYMFGLHLAVRFWNRKQSEIRRAEAGPANVP
jgi:hypothetical protein